METSGLEGFHRARERFEEWLRTHSPADLEALRPPARPQQITEVEEAYGVTLHPQLKELLLAHDGAREAQTPSDPGCSCRAAIGSARARRPSPPAPS